MPGGIAALGAVVAAMSLALFPARAEALSCTPFDAFESADVAFDGVVLSGPQIGPWGPLSSPARVHVVRYLKGHGPRVLRMGNGTGLLFTGHDADRFTGGDPVDASFFRVAEGDEVRIFGDTPAGAGPSAARGVIWPAGCTGSRLLRRGTLLRATGPGVTVTDARGRAWRARTSRANGPLRCLTIERLGRRAVPADHECVRVRRADALLTAHATAPTTGTSAIAAATPGLTALRAASPDGAIVGEGKVANGVGLVLLRGRVEPRDVRIEATLGDGRGDVRDPTAVAALAPDASDGPPWVVAREPVHPRQRGVACVTYRQRAPGLGMTNDVGRHGVCGRTGSHSRFFAVRRVRRFGIPGQGGPGDHRTVVFGLAGATVSSVTVATRDGERTATRAPRGGAFAVILPAGTSSTQVTVTFHLVDGTVRSYTGIRQANLVSAPESELDGLFG